MTRRIAFLFPGQGAQEVGMGREFFGRDSFADELIDRGSKLCGRDLARLCARGPDRLLAETENLQPALAAVSLVLWRRLCESGVTPFAAAGHSVGELPALAAGGMIEPSDVMEIAAARGRLMAKAASAAKGGMMAITGVASEKIIDAVKPLEKESVIGIAAVNAPNQVTVSGELELLGRLAEEFHKVQGAMITRLRVSGAWHSEHMRPAMTPLLEILRKINVCEPSVSIALNRDGGEIKEPDKIREYIVEQLVRPVRWDLVMKRLVEMGTTDFVEIGPGRVLRGLVRLNCGDPSIAVHNVFDVRSVEITARALLENRSV